MLLARVKEPIVCTVKEPGLTGNKLLLAEILTSAPGGLVGTGRHLVCLDAVGAGAGELVLAVQGSSARMAPDMGDSLTDTVIVGIIDKLCTGGQEQALAPGGFGDG
jgi:ethanolamine utilization protein EutN